MKSFIGEKIEVYDRTEVISRPLRWLAGKSCGY